MRGLVISTAFVFAFGAGAALAEPPQIDLDTGPHGNDNTFVGHNDAEGDPAAGRWNGGDYTLTSGNVIFDEAGVITLESKGTTQTLPGGAGHAFGGNPPGGPGVENNFGP